MIQFLLLLIIFGSQEGICFKIQTSYIPVMTFCLMFSYWSKIEIPQPVKGNTGQKDVMGTLFSLNLSLNNKHIVCTNCEPFTTLADMVLQLLHTGGY